MSWPFIRTLIDLDEVASTNDVARTLAHANELECPFAVRALRQTRGRGRGSNSWWSDEGSLTFTLAIDPADHGLQPLHEPRLALATAVAMIDVLNMHWNANVEIGVRWPNDVEVAGKKIAGILPEKLETPAGPRILIGIGLNVETRLDEAPAQVRRMATTLRELDPFARFDRDRFLGQLLGAIGNHVARLADDDPRLSQRWGMLDTIRGKFVRVDLEGRVVSGRGAGIDSVGALIVETDEGPIKIHGGRVLRDV